MGHELFFDTSTDAWGLPQQKITFAAQCLFVLVSFVFHKWQIFSIKWWNSDTFQVHWQGVHVIHTQPQKWAEVL